MTTFWMLYLGISLLAFWLFQTRGASHLFTDVVCALCWPVVLVIAVVCLRRAGKRVLRQHGVSKEDMKKAVDQEVESFFGKWRKKS